METTAEGLMFLETTYYLSESIANPLKGAVYALKYTQCGRELTLCLMWRKSQFVPLIFHTNRDKDYLMYFSYL